MDPPAPGESQVLLLFPLNGSLARGSVPLQTWKLALSAESSRIIRLIGEK